MRIVGVVDHELYTAQLDHVGPARVVAARAGRSGGASRAIAVRSERPGPPPRPTAASAFATLWRAAPPSAIGTSSTRASGVRVGPLGQHEPVTLAQRRAATRAPGVARARAPTASSENQTTGTPTDAAALAEQRDRPR